MSVSLRTGILVLRGWAESTPALDNCTVRYWVFPAGAVFGTSRDVDRRILEQQVASSFYAALCSATDEGADPLSCLSIMCSHMP